MSSLTFENKARKGYRYRAYIAQDGARRRLSIWLGDIPDRDAAAFQAHCDAILTAQTEGIPITRQTKQWIDRLPVDLREKLQPVFAVDRPVHYWCTRWLSEIAPNVAESTHATISDSIDHLLKSHGTRQIRGLCAEELIDWQSELQLAKSTVGKIGRHLRMFFAWCVKQRVLDQSPADELATGSEVGTKQFVDRATIERLLAACRSATPLADTTQRTEPLGHDALGCLIRWARFGGLRIPSEIRSLRPEHIDEHRKRITIHDTKRGSTREIPMFAELPPADSLNTHAWLALAELPASTLSSRLRSLLESLGIAPWPRLWHSMRATRETELVEQFGLKAAAAWIGNSEAVAMKSYLLITDDTWNKATQ